MTDKNDIEALREFNFDVFMYGIRRDAPFDGSTLADSISDDEVRRAESAFNSLLKRAESAEDLNKHLELAVRAAEGVANSLRRQVEKAEAELSALRGEQEPFRYAVVKEKVNIGYTQTLEDADFMSLQYGGVVIPLYARQPKPVVVKLPAALMPAIHNSGELFMTPDNVEQGGYLNRDDVTRVLRAAGIDVKDGE